MQSVLRNLILGLAAVAFSASMSSVSAQEKKAKKPNPRLGTWTLNVGKSTFKPGPAPKSLTVKYEAADKGTKISGSGIGPDGKPYEWSFTAEYDGKDYPITGSPSADTVSMKKIDSRTNTRTDKKGGKVVTEIVTKLSKDGKSFTADVKSKTPKGEPVRNKLLFERT